MFDPNWPDLTHPPQSFGPGSRERVPAFVARRGAFFVLVGVLLAQLLLLSTQITRGRNVRLIQVWTVAVFEPFERAFHGTINSTTYAWNTLKGLWNAQEENQVLKTELQTEQVRLQQLSDQAADANRLRALLDFKAEVPYLSIAAEVIASSPDEASTAVFINRGTDAGLSTDLPVITPEGIIGKTVVVYKHTTQVLLITDPSSGVGCMLKDTRTQGILKGDSRNLCQLRYVMDDEKVPIGEIVLTSGLDQIFPKGLTVGTVLSTATGNIYQRIVVKPAAALSRLENVLVLLKPAGEQQPTREPATLKSDD